MKKFYLVLLALIVVGSCASGVTYTRFVIDPVNDKLLAHDPKDDLPLALSCAADEHDKAKCIGMLRTEFFKMETELLETRQALSDCQAR